MGEDELEEVLSVRDIAQRFSVNGSTVRRMIYKGVFPHAFKFGGVWKVPRSDVDAVVHSRVQQPPTD